MSAPAVDPRRPEKINRYKAPQNAGQGTSGGDDFMSDYMNILGMIFSMCGLMMKLKWCGKSAVNCEPPKSTSSSFMFVFPSQQHG